MVEVEILFDPVPFFPSRDDVPETKGVLEGFYYGESISVDATRVGMRPLAQPYATLTKTT